MTAASVAVSVADDVALADGVADFLLAALVVLALVVVDAFAVGVDCHGFSTSRLRTRVPAEGFAAAAVVADFMMP